MNGLRSIATEHFEPHLDRAHIRSNRSRPVAQHGEIRRIHRYRNRCTLGWRCRHHQLLGNEVIVVCFQHRDGIGSTMRKGDRIRERREASSDERLLEFVMHAHR